MKTSMCLWIVGSLTIASGCGQSKTTQRAPDHGAEDRSEVILDGQDDEEDLDEDINDFDEFEDDDLDNDNLDIQRISPTEEETCYKGDDFLCEVEAAIVRQTNDLRAPAQPFEQSAKIGYVARLWSESMGGIGFISHFGFPRGRASDYQDEFGGSASMMAENVAMNYSDSQDAEDVARAFTEMWWDSSGHRRNMQGDYEMLGVGVYRSGSRYYATQIFGRE